MQDSLNLKLDWDVTRIDFIYQIEMLDIKDMGSYVHECLLPNLQKSYKHTKQYLSTSSRKNIYSIKKLLADLIEDHNHIKISTHEDYGSEYFTKHEALFLLTESLNLIHFFAAIIKEKTKDIYWNSEYKVLLQTIIKLTQLLRKDIQHLIEME
ncbi:hypothetical protein RBH29_07715 [Herbivorax sp. ANBcel31]|uniref:hypothetical protein n=1 Tax=Herbivorax sp. ANBcel31 TaxID=3069754 RepID=UPI0027B5FA3C|nr:hypothetical protein [Herbivorax sp. ANBcel31]MDQ2086315.1 hypothetical protein [Herbivorax sp. ANBcel31]